MTEKQMVEPWQFRTRVLESVDGRARAEARRFGALNGGRPEPYLKWFGGFICVLLAVVVLAAIAHTYRSTGAGIPPTNAGATGLAPYPQAVADRRSCAEIGGSDLRSPAEGVWFQASCLASREPSLTALITDCNRVALDDRFALVAPGLYVFRPTQSSGAFLWYARSATCLDLVSTRAVTAVCVDQTVSFNWNARAACATHGDVLAWVNGR